MVPGLWKTTDYSAYLEEAEFIWSLVRADDQGLHVPHVDVTAGDGERCAHYMSTLPARVREHDLQRSEPFWSSLSSYI